MKQLSTFSNVCFIASFFIALSGTIRAMFAHYHMVSITTPHTILIVSLFGGFFGTLLGVALLSEIASKWAKKG